MALSGCALLGAILASCYLFAAVPGGMRSAQGPGREIHESTTGRVAGTTAVLDSRCDTGLRRV